VVLRLLILRGVKREYPPVQRHLISHPLAVAHERVQSRAIRSPRNPTNTRRDGVGIVPPDDALPCHSGAPMVWSGWISV
jgi:hypothetical protein